MSEKNSIYYKLDENKNVVPSTMKEWASFIGDRLPTNYKHVCDEIVDGKRVSTVFIGLGINFDPHSNVPIVFETMVFDGGRDIYMDRYSTWKEAEEGHKKAVEWVKNGCKKDGSE